MTNNEFLTKETNEIIKSALTGGTFEYLANSVAKQLPTRADGSTPSKSTITYEEIYCAVFNMMEKALTGKSE
ncbi:hypothetical protein F5G77_14565 [Salmonella enterica]|nr:hypothetical protein [Salmonella enterica]